MSGNGVKIHIAVVVRLRKYSMWKMDFKVILEG